MIDATEAHESRPNAVSTGARVDMRSRPLIMPIPKASKLLGVSRSAAYRCVAAGELPTHHLGGRLYVVTAKLRELLESAT